MFQFSRKNPGQLSDEELISLYRKKGEIKHAGMLFDRYVDLVYGVCLKYLKDRDESKDAVMQIFEKIIEELRHREVQNFKSWLYVVTKNFCLMALRNKKSTVDITEITEKNSSFLVESSGQMHPIDEALHSKTLKKCLEELPDEQKQCIELFYYKEKCYKEISEITNYEMNRVKSYLQNGKRNLKNCMEKYDEHNR